MSFDPESVRGKLQGYPPEVAGSFATFASENDFAAFEAGFLGALGFLSEASDFETVRNAPDDARLREDLNIDSLAIVELVFLVEDIFGISIGDTEIQQVQTVADFKRLAREKLAARPV